MSSQLAQIAEIHRETLIELDAKCTFYQAVIRQIRQSASNFAEMVRATELEGHAADFLLHRESEDNPRFAAILQARLNELLNRVAQMANNSEGQSGPSRASLERAFGAIEVARQSVLNCMQYYELSQTAPFPPDKNLHIMRP